LPRGIATLFGICRRCLRAPERQGLEKNHEYCTA
jgi:ribosomal protein S14